MYTLLSMSLQKTSQLINVSEEEQGSRKVSKAGSSNNLKLAFLQTTENAHNTAVASDQLQGRAGGLVSSSCRAVQGGLVSSVSVLHAAVLRWPG